MVRGPDVLTVCGRKFRKVVDCGATWDFDRPRKYFRHCSECGESELKTDIYSCGEISGDMYCAECLGKMTKDDIVQIAAITREEREERELS